MNFLLRNIFLGFLTVFVLATSTGLSFSKVSCLSGEQYVIGSEMPSCNKGIKKCCKAKKEKSGNQYQTNDNRKKETFYLKIDFKTCFGQVYKVQNNNSFVVYKSINEQQGLLYSYQPKHKYHRCNPPPLILKPKLSFLQTFLI